MKKVKIPRSETVAFVAAEMKKNPEVEMSELKKLGKSKGHKVYPLIIGLARKELGMSKPKPAGAKRKPGRPAGKRGPGRPPGKRGPGRPPGRRGRGRPRKVVSMAAGLTGIGVHMRGLEREVESLRKALGRIADIAAKV